ncbi:MAG: glycosyltransferase [Gammaproteobacteria bacterium]|nr:glycosyltransferase [Gammaproteobacteria bacterium]
MSEQPLLSVFVPTYNRGKLLDLCLTRLAELDTLGINYEVVISDNGSKDDTPEVVAEHARSRDNIRYFRLPQTLNAFNNYINALSHTRGKYVTYLADDDRLIPAGVERYLAMLESDPELQAVFADWIAYDDRNGCELHRNFNISEPLTFDKTQSSLDILSVLLGGASLPEIGIMRREAVLGTTMFPCHLLALAIWRAYRLARMGRIRFELEPFYIENRILKEGYARDYWLNVDMQDDYFNQELVTVLDNLILFAIQDRGYNTVPDDLYQPLKRSLDACILAGRDVFVNRQIKAGQWRRAVEFRRREQLWLGGSTDAGAVRHELTRLSIPALLEHTAGLQRSLSDAAGVFIYGFVHPDVMRRFLGQHFPDIPLLGGLDGLAPGTRAVVVVKTRADAEMIKAAAAEHYFVIFERDLDFYRIARTGRVDLSQL